MATVNPYIGCTVPTVAPFAQGGVHTCPHLGNTVGEAGRASDCKSPRNYYNNDSFVVVSHRHQSKLPRQRPTAQDILSTKTQRSRKSRDPCPAWDLSITRNGTTSILILSLKPRPSSHRRPNQTYHLLQWPHSHLYQPRRRRTAPQGPSKPSLSRATPRNANSPLGPPP